MNSKLESLLLAQIRGAKLPEPACGKNQVRLYPRKLLPGRKKLVPFRLDFAWQDQKLALEVQGGTWVQGRHSRGLGAETDCMKQNEAVAQGWRILKATTNMVRDGRALDVVREALEQ